MNTMRRDGSLFELGPQSFQGTPLLMQLIRELKIEGELCQGDNKSPRYVLRNGRLQKIAMSPQAMLGGSFLSPKSRWKIASEAFRRTTPPTEEESIASFVRRKFGHEILEYLVSPFVSGVYAGDPETLSLKAAFPSLDEWEREYGSVIRGAMKSRKESQSSEPPPLCSFRDGITTLTGALASTLGDAAVQSKPTAALLRGASDSPRFVVRFTDGVEKEAAAAIVATPAYAASHIVQPLDKRLTQTLNGIPYASIVVFGATYYDKQADMPPSGFGVLIPRSEKIRTLGIVFNSSLFPARAAEGQFTITSFLGGATDPHAIDQTDDQIAAIATKDSAAILGITGEPADSLLWRHVKALPQYNLGHGHIVEAIRTGERANPGLFFSGNYLEGPSIGKCVEHAFKTAEAVRDYINRPGN